MGNRAEEEEARAEEGKGGQGREGSKQGREKVAQGRSDLVPIEPSAQNLLSDSRQVFGSLCQHIKFSKLIVESLHIPLPLETGVPATLYPKNLWSGYLVVGPFLSSTIGEGFLSPVSVLVLEFLGVFCTCFCLI